MVDFTEQIGDISATPHIAPGVVDLSKAELIKKVGTNIHEALKGYEDAKLEGGEVDDEEVAAMFEQEGPPDIAGMNLSQIASARDQGFMTPDAAKIRVQAAVKRASNAQPGRASEFRKQAAQFFGEFGPGQGALDPTAAEIARAKRAERMQKDRDDYIIEKLHISPLEYYNMESLSPQKKQQLQEKIINADQDYVTRTRAKEQAELLKAEGANALPALRTAMTAEAKSIGRATEQEVLKQLNISDVRTLSDLPKGDREAAKRVLQQTLEEKIAALTNTYLPEQVPIAEINAASAPARAYIKSTIDMLEGRLSRQNYEDNIATIEAADRAGILATPEGRALIQYTTIARNVQLPIKDKETLERLASSGVTIMRRVAGLLDPPPPEDDNVVSDSIGRDPQGTILGDAQAVLKAAWGGIKARIVDKGVKSSVVDVVTPEETVEGEIEDYLRVLASLSNDSVKQPIQNLSTLMTISQDPVFVKVLKKYPELAQSLKDNFLSTAVNATQKTLKYLNTQWTQDYAQGEVKNFIRMKLDTERGIVYFVPVDGVTSARMPYAKRVASEFTDKYAHKINQSIRTLTHLDGSFEYAEGMRRLFRGDVITFIPPELLTPEFQDALDSELFAEAGGTVDIIPPEPEKEDLSKGTIVREERAEELPPIDKAFVNQYITEVGDTDEDLNELLEDQRLKEDSKLRLRVIRWFQELAGE